MEPYGRGKQKAMDLVVTTVAGTRRRGRALLLGHEHRGRRGEALPHVATGATGWMDG